MNDFDVADLYNSKIECVARLVNILTPLMVSGIKSIFNDSLNLCKQNKEVGKYLMTFQNTLGRIPHWNQVIIDEECARIIKVSGCAYLEDLLTCVHIIMLKSLAYMRVGQKAKKINIDIPKLQTFVHKCYIQIAKDIYKNVYLFDVSVQPLETQKNNREIEVIVKQAIINSVRANIPIDVLLKAYMDETTELEVEEEIVEEPVKNGVEQTHDLQSSIQGGSAMDQHTNMSTNMGESLKFNDTDFVLDHSGQTVPVVAPKTIERLEEISMERNMQRKMEELQQQQQQQSGDSDTLQILGEIDDNDPILGLNDNDLDDLMGDIEVLV